MTNSPSPQIIPLTLDELPGRVGKTLEVPPGYRGVVIYPDGERKTFPPGKHRLLSAGERVRGRGAGLRVGLVAERPVQVWASAEGLLSGDDALLDAALLCWGEISDPAAFFEHAAGTGAASAPALTLDAEALRKILLPLTRRYEAADLTGNPAAVNRLRAELENGMGSLLLAQGVQVQQVGPVYFSRAADRVKIAEMQLELQERLRDVDLQRQFAAIETQAQMEDFLRQMEDEFGVKFEGAAETAETSGGQPTPGSGSPAETRMAFLKTLSESGLPRLNRWFRREKQKSAPQSSKRRYPKYWWLGRALWMLFVVLFALGATKVINWWASGAESGDRWGLVLAVWGFAVMTLLESIKSLYQKREKLSEQNWAAEGEVFIDDLTGSDRRKADAFVRRQCAQDLGNAYRILDDLQSGAFRHGSKDLALQIKRLRSKVDEAAEDVQNPNVGTAPYVTDLKISRQIFEKMLDYDEKLLTISSALGDGALEMQKRFRAGEFSPDALDKWETELDTFRYYFERRSQALKVSE